MTSNARDYIPANSILTLIPVSGLLIVLSRTSTQRLAFLSRDAEQRTYSLRIPSHLSFSSARSGATTDANAVVANDAYIADRVNDVGLCVSFPLLVVLADVRIGTALKITGRRGAYRAGATV